MTLAYVETSDFFQESISLEIVCIHLDNQIHLDGHDKLFLT